MATRTGSERKRKGKAPIPIGSSVRSRKPLSDCSNILAPRKSSSTKPNPNPVLSTPYRTRQVKKSSVASNPRTPPASPASVPTTFSSVSGRNERAVFEPRSVYTRKKIAVKRKDNDKAVAVPVSSISKRLRDDLSDEGPSRTTRGKPKEKNRDDLSEIRVDAVIKNCGVSSGKESSQDLDEYVRQQKSYFEEVDAFELLVEEVSDDELE